ncbi:hypothetical protein KKD49_06615 [Myxococcota bacterium]|nr:hypothetical protein [Myxococcota bacterium]
MTFYTRRIPLVHTTEIVFHSSDNTWTHDGWRFTLVGYHMDTRRMSFSTRRTHPVFLFSCSCFPDY